jgi:hypothetical protein
VNEKRVEIKFGMDFESNFLFFLSFFSIILSLFFFFLAFAINLWAFNPYSHERVDHDPLPKFSTLKKRHRIKSVKYGEETKLYPCEGFLDKKKSGMLVADFKSSACFIEC